ncbi:MAG: prephenate dehydratase [Deltaproteobacteria bacterium]|nr:prephenate dehydratase [Deltaproteobacteria bacterium]
MSDQENTTVKELSGLSINELRARIDRLDRTIVQALNERLLLARAIGEIKKKEGLPVVDLPREREVLARLEQANEGPLPNETLRYVYTEVMAASRRIQKPVRVAFLGPEATFTHLAAVSHFGRATSFVPQPSIRDVFEEVEKKNCAYGVVPVENSIEGAVNHTLDLFPNSDLLICAEIYSAISHDLLSRETAPDQVQTIFSHPQALAQCRQWLRKHMPAASLVECGSTSEAAHKAACTPRSAAVAGSQAAMVYDLLVLASRIEDSIHNVTRFLVIGPDRIPPTGRDKTSLVFATAHVPGALYQALGPIADAGVNMVKLESRPSKSASWHYQFFVDVEGHLQDPPVARVVEQMHETCAFVKWLGSYPQAEI